MLDRNFKETMIVLFIQALFVDFKIRHKFFHLQKVTMYGHD